ncbi:MAG: ABC transporter substrate-binding protein [Deltaproteobacteria bacterium]|nr:MAG: ABC transporter substrate-binding protein [Deltaproteobacteria bacterium]
MGGWQTGKKLIFALMACFFVLVFLSCEGEKPSVDTKRVEKLEQRVDELSKKVDQLSGQLEEIKAQLYKLVVKAPSKGGNLTICVADEPPGLDPTASASAAIDRVVYANIYEGLIKVDRTGKYVPGLALTWDISTDGKVYNFQLRKGVTFHNGEPFNAAVAKWNIERGAAEGTKNAHPEFFRIIEKIETPDESTLKLTLKNPDSLFIVHMAEGDAVMLPMKGYENTAAHPIGTGPFKFVAWNRGDRVEMARNERYWNPQLPYLDKVIYRFIGDASAMAAALKAGDVDIIGWLQAPELAADFAKDKRFKVLSGSSVAENIMSTNNKVPPFDNKLVRQAMAHAIDRKAVIDLVMAGYGTPIGSHWPPVTPYYEDLTGKFPYNPQKAKELLAKAGYPNGFEATIKLPAIYAYSKRAGEVIADMLGQVGIRLKIELVEWGVWLDRVFKQKDFQLSMIGHAEAWDIGIYANPTYYFQYDSKEFQEAYANALKATTTEAQSKWFKRCQEIIAEDAVNGYLFVIPSLSVMKAELMNWWKDYPTIVLDCTEVWWNK